MLIFEEIIIGLSKLSTQPTIIKTQIAIPIPPGVLPVAKGK